MALTLRTTRPMPRPGWRQALGWIVMGDGPERLIFHDGGTFGFASAVAWDPARHTGVVVLSNQLTSVADLAHHLLRPSVRLEKPTATRRTEIPLDPSLVERYVGRYDEPEGTFVVAREGDFLTIKPPPDWGLPRMRLRPESRRDFFASELPLRVTFEEDAAGVVTGLIVHPPRGQPPIHATRTPPKP
jgi:CubicO group peptidase (beta-lactamase class C family)